ncbi:hypothetical protein ABZ733_10465 [Streptomyces longwoodensis]|uniref:hypothetical protein n=1 Tax=Streptomyces longwoodensis TaxID=68231 RepID=UPI0033FA95D8
MDLSDEGEALSPEWAAVGNNVCGTLHGCRNVAPVAERFVRAGWRSRSSSWEGYEAGTSWCEVELDPMDGVYALLDGVIDPSRLNDLLYRFGKTYTLELYDEEGALVREIRTER